MDRSEHDTPARRPVSERILDPFAWLVLVLMVTIVVQVVASALDFNPLATFRRDLPVLGRTITLNSLLDFQWHLLVVIALLPIGLVWWRDGHVRVDFLYSSMSRRAQARIDLIGNLCLTLPFLVMSIPAAWSFMLRALATHEQSANGGLTDRFLIKAVLPLGFALLGVVLLAELPRLLRRASGKGR